MFVVRCKKEGCGELLRPHVVWFGEGLDPQVMSDVQKELDDCDLCLVVSKLSLVINIWMIYWQDFQISSSHPWYSTHPSSGDRGLTVYMYNVKIRALYSNAVRPGLCEGWHFTHMRKTFTWPHNFTKRGGLSHKTSFIEVPLPSQESVRSCTEIEKEILY